ncbi:adenylate/guanylate cyclase domain-containing protein [Nocardioides donggukensis]|uniref:Adenylate/guanylate cyclase domain-containing protein n=1 Tax=Nocardioides donggukensis TaxID=2774019 RepID=A0A927Q146_9ACTN|nr:adenylate/guanylate cyclase domain-containing protein [Nocardioides donggukensis]MBD8868396.1 adenylate/guanylate cyclase domain-containing protein [Nocardioides donggukensis]
MLGQRPHLSRAEVLERSGVSRERAQSLWLSLGFSPPLDDDEVMFTEADVEALGALTALIDSGIVDPRTEFALTRSMGRSFARLAEWEVGELAGNALSGAAEVDPDTLEEFVSQTLPEVERLQSYIWRRHLAGAAGRLLLAATGDDDAVTMTVGFADIVGFTRRSRHLSVEELGSMVETFESTVTRVIADQGGQVIKTIGDEVLFAADDPLAGARIALLLAAGHKADDDFPEVRVGLAHGPVLRRLGDVFGEVVNIASRLTGLARPGRILTNRELADRLADHPDDFRVRRARTAPVKGYHRLEAWALKPPRPPREPRDRPTDPREALGAVAERLPLPRTH